MKRLLTICIFNYNDAGYWQDLVRDALSHNDKRFQILLQDNCSTDETEEIAKGMADCRFLFRKNDENVGAPMNAVKCLQNVDSEYCLLAMTRDRLNVQLLPVFLDYLEKEKPDFGIVSIASSEMMVKTEIFPQGSSALSRSYLGHHSTGHFWKTSLVDRELSYKRFWENIEDVSFTHDLINGGAAVDHSLTEINLKLFTPIKSLPQFNRPTYTESKDLFFLPENRIKTLNVYFAHINSLDVENEIKVETAELLLSKCVDMLTYGIMGVYQNGNAHYKTPAKKYGFKDFYKNYTLILNFIKKQNYFDHIARNRLVNIVKTGFRRNFKTIYFDKLRTNRLISKVHGKIRATTHSLF